MDAAVKSYLIDASVVLAWFLPCETYQLAANKILELYQEKKIKLLAPSLISYEVVNGLYAAVLSQRISPKIALEQISLYQNLEIEFLKIDEEKALQTALEENLSAYDSAYISLMIVERKNFLTADKKLYQKLKNKFPQIVWLEDFPDFFKRDVHA